MHVEQFRLLAEAVRQWRVEFDQREYRSFRLALFLESQRGLAQADHLRAVFIPDRRPNLDEGLEAWLVDYWLATTRGLAHGLQILVCPEGLEEPPLPEGHWPADQARGPYHDPKTDAHYLWFPAAVKGAEHLRCQFFLPDVPVPYTGRLSRSPYPWQWRSSLRFTTRTTPEGLLAQMLLIALRQNVAAQDAHDWLVVHGRKATPAWARDFLPDAVNHAVLHFLLPLASVATYLSKVARAMAQGNEPPEAILQIARATGVPVRTAYRSRARGESIEELRERRSCREQRLRLARWLAEKEGISYRAARMRIQRLLNKGIPLERVASRFGFETASA